MDPTYQIACTITYVHRDYKSDPDSIIPFILKQSDILKVIVAGGAQEATGSKGLDTSKANQPEKQAHGHCPRPQSIKDAMNKTLEEAIGMEKSWLTS